MNIIIIIVVEYTTNHITRGREWSVKLLMSGTIPVTPGPTITNVIIGILTVTKTTEGIAATTHNGVGDALIIQNTEICGLQ